MQIKSISVQNFRSIRNATFECRCFNIFVGPNNAGKTNLFEAIEWFFNGKGNLSEIAYLQDPNNEVVVSITFSNAQDGANKMKAEANRTKILTALGGADEVTITRSSSEQRKRTFVVAGTEVKPGTGFDPALNDFLPKFEYISTKHYYDSVTKYDKKTPVGIMLSDVLNAILESDPQYIEFQDKFSALFADPQSNIKKEFDKLGTAIQTNMHQQFPECVKVAFTVVLPGFDELLKRFDTSVDDGVETTAEEKGDGMQRALMLSVIQAYAAYRKLREDTDKSFLFFIDEAELHLHPAAQRKLKNVLLELCAGMDQVFITTHSSVLVVDNHSLQLLFKVERDDSITSIEPVQGIAMHSVIFDLLGGSPADLLLPRNFLVVEGRSEQELLTRVIERFYPDEPPISIIPANGDVDQTARTINAIEKTFSVLGSGIYGARVVLLCDKPSREREGGVRQFLDNNKELRKNNQVFFLSETAIEECYPPVNGWRKTHEEQEKMTGRQKKQLAKRVGNEITEADLKKFLPQILESLNQTWRLAF